MASAVKKPPATGRETPTGTPQRPTPRASTPSSTNSPGAAGANRTRSTRTGTPVSARVAASQRRESLLSNGTAANGKGSSSPSDFEREEAIRAETVAIIDDLKERLAEAESASETFKRQVEVLQSKLDDALKEQARLEEKVHESEEQIESLTNEKREIARQMREMENIYEAERSAMMKEKEEMANREEEMQAVIQRLKDSLAQRNDEDRPSRQSVSTSPGVDNGSFAPPSSVHRSDSRNNSKLLLQKDKLIESLRLELAEVQIKLAESQNEGGGRLQEVERQLMEARVANARLMEDNESYQLLLQEKTLKGDFPINDLSYSGGASANQDALAALEGRKNGTSLADELSVAGEDEDAEAQRRLEIEVELKLVKDQNKALTLFINDLLERLLQHDGFEHILDRTNDTKAPQQPPPPNTNKALPPAPAANKAASPGPSLLQRAKSMAIGGGNNAAPQKPKPRPVTVMSSTTQSAISNPDTAPSIPIGLPRTASARRGRPMSEQYTGAASIVNAMYKGAADHHGAGGPLSPASLRASQTFFLPQGAGNRRSSGNFPGMRSETSSTSGDSVSLSGTAGADAASSSSSPHSHSPPRAHHRQEKTTTLAGNKPKPLRLLGNTETAAQNKRQSWIGWVGSAFGGGGGSSSSSGGGGNGKNAKEDAASSAGREVIRE